MGEPYTINSNYVVVEYLRLLSGDMLSCAYIVRMHQSMGISDTDRVLLETEFYWKDIKQRTGRYQSNA